MSESEEIARALLRKLLYLGKWGGSHTSFGNLPKGFPKHLRGAVKKVAEDIIRAGVLLRKPTSYGAEISLNVGMKREIERILVEQP